MTTPVPASRSKRKRKRSKTNCDGRPRTQGDPNNMRFLSILLLGAALFASEKDSFFLKNVTVFPVSSPKIDNTSLLVIDGKISSIGAKSSPKGVRVIDVIEDEEAFRFR